ncbi:MAG: hypothetical protein ACRD0Z_17270 [Acidimicrobiales bacterium]
MAIRPKALVARFGVAALIVSGAIATAGVASATPQATSATPHATGHFATPKAGTIVKGALKKGTKLVFRGTINGIPITVSCTAFKANGKVPKTGLTIGIPPPSITGCTDSLGGKDTIKDNATDGTWRVTETIASSGDKVSLVVPKAGATFTSTVVSGCKVTAAPTARAAIVGKYNNVNTATVSKAKIPVSGKGCTATAATVTSTIIFTPDLKGVA